jgi:hypothetical protein
MWSKAEETMMRFLKALGRALVQMVLIALRIMRWVFRMVFRFAM